MIQLSDHFNYKRLLLFTLPSIAMLIFTSVYGVVDGFFVSNYAGKTPFAAVNLIYPRVYVRHRRERVNFVDNGGGKRKKGK